MIYSRLHHRNKIVW